MKYMIVFLVIVCTVLFYWGNQEVDANKNVIKTPGTLYTGMPDEDDSYYAAQSRNLKQFSNVLGVLPQHRLAYGDIWLRDIAPIIGKGRMVKFKYEPNYLEADFVESINQRFAKWLMRQRFDLVYSDLKLDGGNFVYNDEDTVILTKRVLSDNPEYSKAQIVSELKKVLNIKQIILVDEERGDVMGHADGMLFFINPNELFIGDFEGANKVEAQIKKANPSIKMIHLPSAYTEKGQYDDEIPSAKGLYTNMLVTEKQIFVPQYQLSADKKVLAIVKQHTDKQVIPVQVGKIATMGGSVHCLTWYVPKAD